MKKIVLILISFSFFGAVPKNEFCSPVLTPFNELLNTYNPKQYIIVEGYFIPTSGSHYTSKLRVTRSSNKSIKTGKEYDVFEYGPFGSECEMYEMKSNISPELTGNRNSRLLILYKDKSVDGKLVTPIFWEEGVSASNNTILTKKYDYKSKKHVFYQCASNLDEIWKQILTWKALSLVWNKIDY